MRLHAIDEIGRLHRVRVDAARFETARADAEFERAAVKTGETITKRDQAQDCWQAGLEQRCPDPHRIADARDWLIAREAETRAVRLDEAIARRRCDDAAAILAQRHAAQEACDSLARRLKRTASRLREERQMVEIADLLLGRRAT